MYGARTYANRHRTVPPVDYAPRKPQRKLVGTRVQLVKKRGSTQRTSGARSAVAEPKSADIDSNSILVELQPLKRVPLPWKLMQLNKLSHHYQII